MIWASIVLGLLFLGFCAENQPKKQKKLPPPPPPKRGFWKRLQDGWQAAWA